MEIYPHNLFTTTASKKFTLRKIGFRRTSDKTAQMTRLLDPKVAEGMEAEETLCKFEAETLQSANQTRDKFPT